SMFAASGRHDIRCNTPAHSHPALSAQVSPLGTRLGRLASSAWCTDRGGPRFRHLWLVQAFRCRSWLVGKTPLRHARIVEHAPPGAWLPDIPCTLFDRMALSCS